MDQDEAVARTEGGRHEKFAVTNDLGEPEISRDRLYAIKGILASWNHCDGLLAVGRTRLEMFNS